MLAKQAFVVQSGLGISGAKSDCSQGTDYHRLAQKQESLNAQHPTSNVQRPSVDSFLGCWALVVGCWMLIQKQAFRLSAAGIRIAGSKALRTAAAFATMAACAPL
jgi:hypothetical protein